MVAIDTVVYNTDMKKQYITSDPDIMGGQPVVKGTRIPISRVLYLLKQGYTVEAIHEEYPHVDIEVLNGAIEEVIETITTVLHAKRVS